jgi:hypothetical protein
LLPNLLQSSINIKFIILALFADILFALRASLGPQSVAREYMGHHWLKFNFTAETMHIIMKDENKKKANESIQLLQQQMSNLIATYKQIT